MKKLEEVTNTTIEQAQDMLDKYFKQGKDVALKVIKGQIWIVEYL